MSKASPFGRFVIGLGLVAIASAPAAPVMAQQPSVAPGHDKPVLISMAICNGMHASVFRAKIRLLAEAARENLSPVAGQLVKNPNPQRGQQELRTSQALEKTLGDLVQSYGLSIATRKPGDLTTVYLTPSGYPASFSPDVVEAFSRAEASFDNGLKSLFSINPEQAADALSISADPTNSRATLIVHQCAGLEAAIMRHATP